MTTKLKKPCPHGMSQDELKRTCTLQPNGDWKCNTCGDDIMAAEVRRSVWDFPEAMAGSGKVVTDYVPYCPTCHEHPNSRGLPVT